MGFASVLFVSDKLGYLLKNTQGFGGHAAASRKHGLRAQKVDYSSFTFSVDNAAWCVVCDVQMAASDVEGHQSTPEHRTAEQATPQPDNAPPPKKQRQGEVPHTLYWYLLLLILLMSLIVAPLPANTTFSQRRSRWGMGYPFRFLQAACRLLH
jgi:hypothetical protein